MMYAVTVLFDASRSVSIEADSPEEAEEKAHNQVGSVSLCHQCSGEVEMGDANGALVYEDDGAGDQVLDTQWSSTRIAALEAEVAALKADAMRYRCLLAHVKTLGRDDFQHPITCADDWEKMVDTLVGQQGGAV